MALRSAGTFRQNGGGGDFFFIIERHFFFKTAQALHINYEGFDVFFTMDVHQVPLGSSLRSLKLTAGIV